MARQWGWWTEHKLLILERYLQEFVTASKLKSTERIYLDLFAGQAENLSKATGREILGSVHRALRTNPPFTRIALFELPGNARRLREALAAEYPDRRDTIRVYEGDCNVTLPRALADLASVRWAPTFAFIDQHDNEIRWRSLEQLARFRSGQWKTEMWILIGPSFYTRGLEVRQEAMNAEYGETLTDMFGCEAWIPIVKGGRRGLLTPRQMYDQFTNLLRWRLQHDLGYQRTYAFTMKNTGGNWLYDMVFATDHLVGDKIMRHLYAKAAAEHEAMRQDALERRRIQRAMHGPERRGEYDLFTDAGFKLEVQPAQRSTVPAGEPAPTWTYEPPTPPYQLPTSPRPTETKQQLK